MSDTFVPLTADHFSPRVGELFQMGDTELSLTLTAVEVHKDHAGEHGSFNLIFRGPKTPWAPEALWALKAADGTVYEIYVAPIHTPDPDRQDYQAVFN